MSLKLFYKTRTQDGVKSAGLTLASWHNPRSITWRWILSVSPYRGTVKLGFFWMRSIKGVNTPFGCIVLHTQRSMWKAQH